MKIDAFVIPIIQEKMRRNFPMDKWRIDKLLRIN